MQDSAWSYLEKFAGYDLAWVEEPADPLDYQLYAEICATTELPIATGENVFSLADARNLLRYGGTAATTGIFCSLTFRSATASPN